MGVNVPEMEQIKNTIRIHPNWSANRRRIRLIPNRIRQASHRWRGHLLRLLALLIQQILTAAASTWCISTSCCGSWHILDVACSVDARALTLGCWLRSGIDADVGGGVLLAAECWLGDRSGLVNGRIAGLCLASSVTLALAGCGAGSGV